MKFLSSHVVVQIKSFVRSFVRSFLEEEEEGFFFPALSLSLSLAKRARLRFGAL